MEQLSLPGVEEHLKKHPLQPHQMSRAQYEADPQTMWRAEGSDTLSAFSGLNLSGLIAGGLHFGDYSAAMDRGEHIAERYGPLEPPLRRPVRMFSLRTKGRFTNEPVAGHPAAEVLPQTKGVAPDADVGDDPWPQRRTGRWYLNEAEGYKSDTDRGPANTPMVSGGTLSGYVPRREGFITTHKEEVLKAHAEGKSVHPAILQQAQIGPEYSGTIDARVADVEPPQPKLFQAINEYSTNPQYVTNEEYNEGMRKMKEGSSEPIWGHIGEPRPAGSPR